MEGILANLNTRVLKEPRGFMKILQFIFSICAFATTTSFSTNFSFGVNCEGGENPNITYTIKENIFYPFQIDSIRSKYEICDKNIATLFLRGDFSSDARFFVAVGVMAFLYIIGALILYIMFSSIYDNNDLIPLADCGAHVAFAVLWLAASSAWANSLTTMQMATNLQDIMGDNPDMCGYKCEAIKAPTYSKLYISVILGFLNMFLWGSNLWFLYKETRLFKDKMNNQPGHANPSGTA